MFDKAGNRFRPAEKGHPRALRAAMTVMAQRRNFTDRYGSLLKAIPSLVRTSRRDSTKFSYLEEDCN